MKPVESGALAALAAAAGALREARSPGAAFAAACEALGRFLPLERASLALIAPGGAEFAVADSGAPERFERHLAARLPAFAAAIAGGHPIAGPLDWPGAPRAAHGLVLPLAGAGGTPGAVALVASRPLPCGEAEGQALEAWAGLLAAALAALGARDEAEGRERAERAQEALRRFGAALASDLDLKATFSAAVGELRQVLGFDEAALLVLDEQTRSLRLFAASIELPDRVEIALRDETAISPQALERGEIRIVEDTERAEYAYDLRLLELGFRSHLACPLRHSGRMVGTLNLASREPGGLVAAPVELLEAVAAHLAMAVHNALLFERVRASEGRYSSLVEGAAEFIYRLDREGRFTFANRAAEALLGRSPGDLVGRYWSEIVHPAEARPGLLDALLAGREAEGIFELRLLGPDGGSVLTRHRIRALAGGFQGIAEDVTREREADRAIRRHQELVEALDDYVFMADTSGRLLAINRKARETLGWTLEEAEGMTIWDLHPPEDRARIERERWRIAESGVSSFEVRLLARNGRTIPTRGRVTYSPESGTFQGVYRDISEEQLMQDRLLQVERLRALGEMASGVAHTFNNLLAVIGTTVQVAKRLTREEAVLEQLKDIEQSVFDGGAAVRRIQDFTRKQPVELWQELDLDELLHETARVALHGGRGRSKGPIELDEKLGGAGAVRGSESQLRDAFVNLIFNAIDAMPEGGRITLRSFADGARLAAEIADTGRGMSAEVRSRIFTPFYSTKGERGSGLGLAIALNVVSQHGGTIEVDSAPGSGTTMRVWLPRAEAASRPTGRPARVLLALAEPLLRTQLQRAVAGYGHEVDPAAGADEARAALERGAYDLVLTDLALEGGSGLELAARARVRGARVVLVAGWGDEVSEETVRAHRIDALLRRPFPAEAVLNLISGLVGS